MNLTTAFGVNLAGQVGRLAIALLTLPLFTNAFGVERYGTYFFLFALMPYFQVQALAVARQVTALSAQAESAGGAEEDDPGPRVGGLGASVALGSAISIILTTAFFVAYPWMLRGVESYDVLAAEIVRARPWATLIVLLDVVVVLQIASLEGRRAFGVSNLSQIVGQAAALVVPLTALTYDGTFDRLLLGVAIGRLVQVGVALKWAPLLPILTTAKIGVKVTRAIGFDFAMLMLSAVANAIRRTLDRILIGATASASALYYYAAPTSATARLAVLGQAMGSTMAPFFAVADPVQRKVQAGRASNVILTILLPVCIGGIVTAPFLLALWVDTDFADRATVFFRLGLVGVMGAAIAQVPAFLLQSTGRSKLVALQHVLELPPFALALLIASTYGLTPVAWVVAMRAVLAGVAHMLIARLPGRTILAAVLCLSLVVVCAVAAPEFDEVSPWARLILGVTLTGGASVALHVALPETLRLAARQIAQRRRGRRELSLELPTTADR